MRLNVADFVLGENMVVHGKDCFKVVFKFVVGGILKRAFCLECGLCLRWGWKILKNKVLEIFSEILVIFCLVFLVPQLCCEIVAVAVVD